MKLKHFSMSSISSIFLLTTGTYSGSRRAHNLRGWPNFRLREIPHQDVGINAEVTLANGQGEVVAVFEEGSRIHHLILAGKYAEHSITENM